MFELKIAIDVVQAEDGKFYVDATTTKAGVVQEWTEGPFDTEAKARESLQWQLAMPAMEKLWLSACSERAEKADEARETGARASF
jgi:hypothetical protein